MSYEMFIQTVNVIVLLCGFFWSIIVVKKQLQSEKIKLSFQSNLIQKEKYLTPIIAKMLNSFLTDENLEFLNMLDVQEIYTYCDVKTIEMIICYLENKSIEDYLKPYNSDILESVFLRERDDETIMKVKHARKRIEQYLGDKIFSDFEALSNYNFGYQAKLISCLKEEVTGNFVCPRKIMGIRHPLFTDEEYKVYYL